MFKRKISSIMKKKQTIPNISKNFMDHNHELCFESALKDFKQHFIKKELKLTPLRLKVFQLLLKDHRPLGAYQILDLLRKDGFSSTPPIAYRVLDFLIEHGFVHKIKKLNAFVACSHPGNSHSPTFIICRKCEKVAEINEKESGLKFNKETSSEFKIEEAIIELIGICKNCTKLEVI